VPYALLINKLDLILKQRICFPLKPRLHTAIFRAWVTRASKIAVCDHLLATKNLSRELKILALVELNMFNFSRASNWENPNSNSILSVFQHIQAS